MSSNCWDYMKPEGKPYTLSVNLHGVMLVISLDWQRKTAVHPAVCCVLSLRRPGCFSTQTTSATTGLVQRACGATNQARVSHSQKTPHTHTHTSVCWNTHSQLCIYSSRMQMNWCTTEKIIQTRVTGLKRRILTNNMFWSCSCRSNPLRDEPFFSY